MCVRFVILWYLSDVSVVCPKFVITLDSTSINVNKHFNYVMGYCKLQLYM